MHPETPSDPSPRFVTFAGAPLAYTDEGRGAHTVVAVPGLPGTVRDFRWLAPALTDHLRFVRVDLPGFGRSPRRGFGGMTIAERAAPVRALIDALDLAPVTLLGHSAGAAVVAHVARHHPQLVRRCVLVASPGPRPHYPLRTYRALSVLFRARLGRAAMRPILRRLYAAFGFPAYLTDDERMYTSLDAAAQDFAAHRANVAAIPHPTLVAWAADDRLVPAALSDALARIAPAGPRLRFPDGGHNLQKTRAVELAAAIRGFLA